MGMVENIMPLEPLKDKYEAFNWHVIEINGHNFEEIVNAVKNIIGSCVLSDINIDSLASFDLEYLFLNIRAKSVGEIIELRYQHIDGKNKQGEECNHIQDVIVNIDEIRISTEDDHTNKIELTDKIGVIMRYPTFEMLEKAERIENDIDKMFTIIAKCIESVWDEDNITTDFTPDEVNAFIDSMTKDQFEKVTHFYETMPKLRHEIAYKCDGCGEEETVVLEGIQSFFT